MTITQKIADCILCSRRISWKSRDYTIAKLPISDEEGEIYLYSGNLELNHFSNGK